MRIRPVLVLAMAFLVASSVSAQRGGQGRGGQERGGGSRAARPPADRPRGNQGRIPPAPEPRNDRAAPREAEHFPTGHVNDTPHVNKNRWYGHEPASDARFHLDRPFEHGHFEHFGPSYRYRVLRIDRDRHRFWFPGGFYFQIADWDWALCEDWCWDCGNDFVVYDDPDHPGWYLVYNVHTGAYVHAMYMGS